MSQPIDFEGLWDRMVEEQLIGRGIDDARLLRVMREIPRHHFVPSSSHHLAYHDGPVPIGYNQTISQPYIVALMIQLLMLSGHETVLEIGTGSGYQTAILSRLAAQIYSLERHAGLAAQASVILNELSCDNVDVHVGDGSQGLPDMAPFDVIVVSAAAPALPEPLRKQLNPLGGRMILPIGGRDEQYLERITRQGNIWQIERLMPVMFVPLIGQHGFSPHAE